MHDLIILRHGETEWNVARRWQGHSDSPLTALGRAQARTMGAMLRALGIGPDSHAFHVSPLGRARATADLILAGQGSARVDPRLSEIDTGGFSGLTQTEIAARTGLGPDTHLLDFYPLAPGGESFEHLFARSAAFLATLTGPSVVITHGITSRSLRAVALGIGPSGWRDVPGGQGIIHRIRDGQHTEISPADLGLTVTSPVDPAAPPG